MERERNKILVAVDGSERTHELIDYLSGVIPAQETELVLFHVMGKVPESFWDWEKDPLTPRHLDHLRDWETGREKQVRDLMRQVRQQFANIGMPEYSIMISIQKVKEGVSRDLLVEAQRGYDAVLMGRRGLGAGEQLLGSTAAKLAAKLGPVNLWLVGGTPRHGRIMIAMDSSEPAMRAVSHVAKMINTSNHAIALVHIVRGIAVASAGREMNFPEEYRQRLLEEAENQIRPAFDRAIAILVEAGIKREKIATKVISGVASRAGALFDEAVREGYGTIVVGRKGLSNVDEFDMGRVTAKLVQLAGGIALWVVG
ncbi:MAG: universal stress protein [Desulfobacteraceae bacterium]|nr:universal stress protein [Desulfobacteraceae bacterium]